MKNTMKRILAAVLSILVIFSMSVTAFAEEIPTAKEEVVYANLKDNGSVDGIYVVNILDTNGKGTISDYGNYSAVRNMTTTDKITMTGESITADTNVDKLYYEGTLSNANLPWNISIRYFINGKEYSAKEAAGKDGKLEIKIGITQNAEANSSFFENYALQASLLLDTKKCTNIAADGATAANVGGKKQLTYTILPNKGKDMTVTADVTDFEMDSIAINGVRLSLDIDIDDDELTDKITELQDSVKDLDEGANDLKSGISDLQTSVKDDMRSGVDELSDGNQELVNGIAELKNGAIELTDGALTLSDGAVELDDGINDLNSGILELRDGLNTLNKNSPDLVDGSAEVLDALEKIQEALSDVSVSSDKITQLTSASSQIKAGINNLYSGADELKTACSYSAYKSTMLQKGLDLDSLKLGNSEAINNIKALAAANGMNAALADSLCAILSGNNAALTGTESYFTQLEQGADELYDGTAALHSSYSEFDSAIQELADTLGDMIDNMEELSDGIDELVSEYKNLDSGISDYTDGVAEIVSSYQEMVDGSQSLVDGSADLKQGSYYLYSTTAELSNGIVELYDGAVDLNDGNTELVDGVTELEDGIVELSDGSSEMVDGTKEFYDKTKDMNSQVDEKINNMIGTLNGGNSEIVSFVSDKNTNIKAVQFVIKTTAIEIEGAAPASTQTKETLTWWQKLLKLFGLS